jgi:hypothetical protein
MPQQQLLVQLCCNAAISIPHSNKTISSKQQLHLPTAPETANREAFLDSWADASDTLAVQCCYVLQPEGALRNLQQ